MKDITYSELILGYTSAQSLQYGDIEGKLKKLDQAACHMYPVLNGNQVNELKRAQGLARKHLNKLQGIERAAETRARNRQAAQVTK